MVVEVELEVDAEREEEVREAEEVAAPGWVLGSWEGRVVQAGEL